MFLRRLFGGSEPDQQAQQPGDRPIPDLKVREHIDISPSDRLYLEGILREIEPGNLSPEDKEERMQDLANELYNYVQSAAMERMSPGDIEPFIRMTRQGKSRAEMDAFLKSRVPGYATLVRKSYDDFKAYYLGQEEG